jgi:hypothetical protein
MYDAASLFKEQPGRGIFDAIASKWQLHTSFYTRESDHTEQRLNLQIKCKSRITRPREFTSSIFVSNG